MGHNALKKIDDARCANFFASSTMMLIKRVTSDNNESPFFFSIYVSDKFLGSVELLRTYDVPSKKIIKKYGSFILQAHD